MEKPLKIIKYALSSVLAFAVDYVLLLTFNNILPVAGLEIGALIAWCVSSLVNFFFNRRFVFNSHKPLAKSFTEYYALAGVVFVLKTYVLLEILTRIITIPIEIAKPVGEVIFFALNYIVQKTVIFKSNNINGRAK